MGTNRLLFFLYYYKMSAPQSNGLYVGNYLLYARKVIDKKMANLLFVDNYSKYFKNLGLDRYDMMILMPFIMGVDPLSGIDNVEPFKYKNESKI